MRRLNMTDLSDVERNSLTLAVASIAHPSLELIEELEDMINESDETSSLLLAYGALVANVGPDKELEMLTFLINRIPKKGLNTNVLIHVLHALGNTRSLTAVQYILPHTQSSEEAVVLAAVTALRLFTGTPLVQQQFIYTLGNSTYSVSLVSAVVNSLRDGYSLNREMTFNPELIEILVSVTNSLGDTDLQKEVVAFFHLVGSSEMLAYADMVNTEIEEGRLRGKRSSTSSTSDWDTTLPEYNAVCPASKRAQDVLDFPNHRGYLWKRCVGECSGSYRFYLQATAGAFAGYNNCNFKVKGKAIVLANVLGRESELINVLGSSILQNGEARRKLYAKFGRTIVLNVDESFVNSFIRHFQLPSYRKTLFSFSYTITVWIIPVTLRVGVDVGISGTLQLSGSVSGEGAPQGTAVLTPSAYASVDASVSVSFLVSVELCKYL